MTLQDRTAENTLEDTCLPSDLRNSAEKALAHILDRLREVEHYPDEALAPYEEFSLRGKVYCFTPGGFLHCKDHRAAQEEGLLLCGYLTDVVWPYRVDDG